MADDNDDLQQELQDDYEYNKTSKGAAISIGVGAIVGGGAGLAVGAEAGAALVIGGSMIAAPVAIPAAIGAVTIGLFGTGIAHIAAKWSKIDALEKDKLKKSLDGVEDRLSAAMRQIAQYKAEEKVQDNERERLSKEIKTAEERMKKQEVLFKKQVEEHGFARDSSQVIMVMIGKTGHGKSTLGNRICGDISKKGNQGPFGVSSKKDKAGTTEVTSTITTAPFQIYSNHPTDHNDEHKEGAAPFQNKKSSQHKPKISQHEPSTVSSLLIVDTPGWGDVDETNRDDHKNLVLRYLKGCGGINSFVMVLSNRDRIDASNQQMLSEYEKLFGDEFWKHLMIIMTRVDDEDDLEEFEEEEHVVVIQGMLKRKFKQLAVLKRDIPVIPIGKKIYKTQTPLIMKKISKEKFTCNALKGPYEELQEKYEALKKKLATIDHKLEELTKKIRSEGRKIEDLKKEKTKLESDLEKK